MSLIQRVLESALGASFPVLIALYAVALIVTGIMAFGD